MPLRPIAFLILFIFGCLYGLTNPLISLINYQLVYFANVENTWWAANLPHLRWSLIAAGFLAFSCLFNSASLNDNNVFRHIPTKLLLLFLFYMILISPFAFQKDLHLEYLNKYWKLVLIYLLIIWAVSNYKSYRYLIWSYLAGISYFGWLTYENRHCMHGGRLEGSFIGGPDCVDANMLGAVLITSIPFLILYLIKGNKVEKIFSLCSLPFILNGIILINSRGAFVGLGTGILLLIILAKGIKTKYQMIFGSLVGIIIFLYLADPRFWERMDTLSDPSIHGAGLRMIYWKAGIKMFLERPFGSGGRGFLALSPYYLSPEYLASGFGVRAVHNTFIQALVEYGIVGILLFVAFLFFTIKSLNKIRKGGDPEDRYNLEATALMTALSSFLTAAIFINRLYSETLYWLCAYAMVLCNVVDKDRHKTTE